MGELQKLPNIGEEMEKQLNQTGINTAEQLKLVGSYQAWLNIMVIDSSVCYNRLCALEGAIEGVRWHHLPDKTKQQLKEFYNRVNR